MSKIKKMIAMVTLLLVMSSVFVACSDDKEAFGPVPVIGMRVTNTTATVIWTIVPNDNCKGYQVTLLKGERDGAEVATEQLGNDVNRFTFTGLDPNTRYTVKTVGIPSSDYDGAEVFYRSFYTAPQVVAHVISQTPYQVEQYNSAGELETIDYLRVNVGWNEFPITNCNGYDIVLQKQNGETWDAAGSFNARKNADGVIPTTHDFEKVVPGAHYRLRARAVGNAMCDYATGDYTETEFDAQQ